MKRRSYPQAPEAAAVGYASPANIDKAKQKVLHLLNIPSSIKVSQIPFFLSPLEK